MNKFLLIISCLVLSSHLLLVQGQKTYDARIKGKRDT